MTFYTKEWLGILCLTCLCLSNSLGADDGLQAAAVTDRQASAQDALEQGPQGYEFSFPAMGTLVSMTAYSDDKSQVELAFALAEERVHQLAAILTDYDPQSETRKLTEQAADNSVQVSDELWQALSASDDWYKKTDGAFDSSLGSLTRLWRKHRRARRIPTAQEISQAHSTTGWQHIELARHAKTVRFDCQGLQLDFGAIGKGVVVDAAFEVLTASGLDCCLVNISGNMRCGRPPPGRNGWRIEIAPLERDGEPLRRIELADRAIATSGDLWQFTEIDGVRRSHILDPSTGLGIPGPIAATVVCATATDADACATAACVLAARDRLDVLEELYPEFAMLIASRPAPEQPPSLQILGEFPK